MSCTVCLKDYINPLIIKENMCCNACDYTACIECVKAYFTSTGKIICMNCRVQFDKNFIYKNLGIKLATELYKKNVITQQMKLVEFEKPLLKYYKDHEKAIIKMNLAIEAKKDFRIESENLERLDNIITFKREELYSSMSNTLVKRYKCINCSEGVILSTDPKCGYCNAETCIDCMKIIDKTHVCNKDDIESVIEIRTSSRQCPNCLISITRTEGCKQMFCTECHTPFSYLTGEIIKNEFFANPHHSEFLKRNPGVNIFSNDEEKISSNRECISFNNAYDIVSKRFDKIPSDIYCKIWRNLYKRVELLNSNHLEFTFEDRELNLRRTYLLGKLSYDNFIKKIVNLKELHDIEIFELSCSTILLNLLTDLYMGVISDDITYEAFDVIYTNFVYNYMKPLFREIWHIRGWTHYKPRII